MEREYLPIPRPLSLPQLPSLFFPAHFSFRAYVRAEALRCPPHYRQSHFVLRVRDSWEYSKTTGSKNDLHGVEPPYLLPLLPLSSNIIRVIVRNVPGLGTLHITNLSHDRLRAA